MLEVSRPPRTHPEHVGPEAGRLVEAGVVPVLTVGRRSLAHGHLRHGPDLWLAGRDGDPLLALVLLLLSVAQAVVAQLPPRVVLSV